MNESWSDEELLDLAAQLHRSGVGRVHRTITTDELVRVQAYRAALDIVPTSDLHAEMEWR